MHASRTQKPLLFLQPRVEGVCGAVKPLRAHLLQGEGLQADAVAGRHVSTVHHPGLELLQTLFC